MIAVNSLVQDLQNPRTKETAFRALVSKYKEPLYWHIRRIVLLHEDADDVLQETFIRIYTYIDTFRGDSKLTTWMYRIATNKAIDCLKAKAKIRKVDVAQIQVENSKKLVEDPYFDGQEIQLKLQEALAQLPHKQRIVFNMKYFDDMTFEQISAIVDTSVGALKASYHHATQKIKTFLEIN